MKKTGLFIVPTFLLHTLLALNVWAESVSAQDVQTLIAPKCLLKQYSITQTTIGTYKDLVLLQTTFENLDKLRAEKRNTGCGHFLNISHDWQNLTTKQKTLTTDQTKTLAEKLLREESALNRTKSNEQEEPSFQISYQNEVNHLIGTFDKDRMWNDLNTLTRFPDRYALSDTGVQTAEWLKLQVETIAKNAGRSDLSVRLVKTGNSYKQPSVVATLAGTEPGAEGVVIGGHMDTLGNNKPGADDDGSGSVTVLETARVILNSGMKFKRPLHFVWYAAEEQGLVGSQYVVSDFIAQKIPVRSVLQLDMTGYQYQNDERIWIMDDYVNASLSKFVNDLIVKYVGSPIGHSKCGYACSDHASWNRKGFKAAMPFEAQMNLDNPNIHTRDDTTDGISLNHMVKFSKLAIAFATELAEPVAAK